MHLCQSFRKRRDKAFHLYNWYCWEKEGYPVPPNVVGTDDTDIFATVFIMSIAIYFSLSV